MTIIDYHWEDHATNTQNSTIDIKIQFLWILNTTTIFYNFLRLTWIFCRRVTTRAVSESPAISLREAIEDDEESQVPLNRCLWESERGTVVGHEEEREG